MKKAAATIGSLFALWVALSIFPSVAQNPQFPQNLPANTVVGRLGIGPGPGQAIPIGVLSAQIGTSIGGNFGLPVADVRNFGVASCTGSTDASTAVASAISQGFFRVFLPAGCLYQPPTGGGNETVPNNIQIIGQNGDPNLGNVSLIRTANRASGSDLLQLGSRSSIQNIAVQSNFCDAQTAPLGTQKVCPVGLAYNSGDQAQQVSNWAYQPVLYLTGSTTTQSGPIVGTDTPIFGLIQNNTGDGIFLRTLGGGVGMRAWTGNTAGDKGVLIQNGFGGSPSNIHTGLHCAESGTNASSACGLFERLNGGTAPLIVHKDNGPSLATTDWDQWIISAQSSGNIRNTFQTSAAFSGAFDRISAGNSGGTFTGQYQIYDVAGTIKWILDANGLTHTGSISLGKPITICGGGNTYTQLNTDYSLISNDAGATCTITLLSAATFSGRIINIKNIQAQTVVSASSNVVPLAGGAAGTAILAATAGKWATLQSDGTNWIVMAGN